MNREDQIRENRRKGAEKARALRNAKYTPEQLKEFSSKGGKNNPLKFAKGDPRTIELSKLGVQARAKSSKDNTSSEA